MQRRKEQAGLCIRAVWSSLCLVLYVNWNCTHFTVLLTFADPENFVRGGGATLTTFFFEVDEGWEDPNTTISGPSSARQR